MERKLIDANEILAALHLSIRGNLNDDQYSYGWDDGLKKAESYVRVAPTVVIDLGVAKTEQKIMRRAINCYGIQAQSDQCVGEMAELTKAIMKARQLAHGTHAEQVAALNNLIEEIADVGIMIDQMRIMYGAASVDAVRERKLAQLKEQLEKLDRSEL